MRRLLMWLILILMAACSREAPVETLEPPSGAISDWRLSIELSAVDLPVQLHLAPDASEAWLSNGVEKVRITEISRDGTNWTLRFPAFNNTLVLKETASGFTGSLTLVKRGYQQHMAVSATPDPGFRFFDNPEPQVDLTGRWEVTFTEDDGTQSFAIGEFDQRGGRISGTFLTAKGDYRYLAGEVDGRAMRLSTFDGAHAFVFSALTLADGTLTGDFWSGTQWHESWVAKRNFDARLPDAWSLTYLKEGYDRFGFTFPDLEGEPVSLDDEKYRDKVVLVSLGGTWCPNCADEMEFLAAVFRENNSRGLEIITLLYEHFEDFDRAAERGNALVQKHDIEFDVLVAGSSDKVVAAQTLPMLNHVLAFPTLIFIDRKGDVRRIHTGFSGPGTGQHYLEFKNEFTSLVDELLSEAVESS